MNFTQFLFPGGRRKPETIDRPAPIETMARAIEEKGYAFEIECFPDTQMVHMDCCNEDEVLANRMCINGPSVPDKVDELVREAHKILFP